MLLVALCAGLCLSLAVLTAGTGKALAAPASGAPAFHAEVTVSEAPLGQLGRTYIGLSFESGTLGKDDRYDAGGNLASLLKTLGTGILRFGGDSADLPSFTGISSAALAGLARLTKASGWSVIYTENLGQFNAAHATADAHAVAAALGSKLFALACGNEPDQFVASGIRRAGWTIGKYLPQADSCYQAIRAGAPKARLAGPDTTNTVAFFRPYAISEAGLISYFSQHYYPLGCPQHPDTPARLLRTLLSPAFAAEETARFEGYAAETRTSRAPLIISETNSGCHNGVAGLSNSYASALWIIDYLLTGAEHGVTEMNISTGLNAGCSGYTVFCKEHGYVYRPQPIYYGMLLTHLLGAGTLDRVQVASSATADNLTAFAVRSPGRGGLRVMVENLSGAKAKVELNLSSYRGSATIIRLTGPAPLATSGARIQRAAVSGNGTIKIGPGVTTRCTAHGCPVTLNPYSAALVKIP